ncbi:MAG: aldo/keto reductase [Pirellulales bacterium]
MPDEQVDPTDWQHVCRPRRYTNLGALGRVCRVGLATRGNTSLAPDDVLRAIDAGIGYLNWCGHTDGMSQAVRGLGPRRRDVIVATQLSARTAKGARPELRELLGELGTDYLDVVTYYYVETRDEWRRILAPGGAAEALEEAKACGVVRAIGVTSHQRPLAAQIVRSRRVDLAMIRYNAAHRGAERDVFPICRRHNVPVVAFTGMRWGALLDPTPDDPPDFQPPPAPDWYRFVLCHPDVTVALVAPDGREELEEDLQLLPDWRGLEPDEYRRLRTHGDRVRRHAGSFP